MQPDAAKVITVTCPHCKQGQYIIYPNTTKVCAVPECKKEFTIEYTVDFLHKILQQVFKDIETQQVKRFSKARKHYLVKEGSGWRIAWI